MLRSIIDLQHHGQPHDSYQGMPSGIPSVSESEFGFSRCCPEIRDPPQRLKPVRLDRNFDMAEAIS
jgi:hypothetical protein